MIIDFYVLTNTQNEYKKGMLDASSYGRWPTLNGPTNDRNRSTDQSERSIS